MKKSSLVPRPVNMMTHREGRCAPPARRATEVYQKEIRRRERNAAGGDAAALECHRICGAGYFVSSVGAIVLLASHLAALPARGGSGIGAKGSSAILEKAANEYWELLKRENLPLRLRLGLPVESLPDLSLRKVESKAAFGRSLLKRLNGLRERDLSHEEQLSLAILRREARHLAEGPRFYWLAFLVTPYSSPIRAVHPVFSSYPFRNTEDGDRYLRLLAQYPRFIEAMEKKLREQARRDIVLPKEEIPLVIGVFSPRPREQSVFWVGPDRLGRLPEADREAFPARVGAVIESQINPALKSLTEFLSGDYQAKAPPAVGLAQYPGGKDYYRGLVKRFTTLDLSPEEVHRIGLEGVETLNKLLDSVRQRVAFAGSLADFRRFLKTDSRFFARTPEEVGERLLAAQNRILERIPAFFGKTPRAAFGVQRLEPELEGSMTFGYYQAPTATDPKGYYRFNGSNLKERSLLDAGALISHELVPGHHFQINLLRENTDLPPFRRESSYTAFTEGWGDYASALAGEMGMYQDPLDLCGRIEMDLFLTSRLVVDTGMNALGWPRARAIEYMKENTLRSDTEIDTETLRYSTDYPGQALAYKIGMRKLVELREKADRALAPAFNIRRFHDAVLGSGALPLDTLERHIDWFIAQEKEAPKN